MLGLWTPALLLSLISLIILATLLLATWYLARADLRLYTHTTFAYGRNAKERILELPSNGLCLLFLLITCVCQIEQIVRWETTGRLVWLDATYESVQTVGYVSAWLALLFIVLAGIRKIPLCHPDNTLTKEVPGRSLATPILHPILVNIFTLVMPILLCITPAVASVLNTFTASATLKASILDSVSVYPAPVNATDTVSHELDATIQQWKIQGYGRALAFFALFLTVLLVEWRTLTRLAMASEYLCDAVAQVLPQDRFVHAQADEKHSWRPQRPPSTLLSRSQSRASGMSKGSFASDRGQSHLLPQLTYDLPSPSLMKDENNYDPAFAYSASLPDLRSSSIAGETSVRPSLSSRASSYYTGQVNLFGREDARSDYIQDVSDHKYCSPQYLARPSSRGSLMLSERSRSRSYASSDSSRSGSHVHSSPLSHSSSHSSCCSCLSRSGCSSSLKPLYLPCYQKTPEVPAPTYLELLRQRRNCLLEAGLLTIILLCIVFLETIYAGLASTILSDKRLQSTFEVVKMVLQIILTLIGLLLVACKETGGTYGWERQANNGGRQGCLHG